MIFIVLGLLVFESCIVTESRVYNSYGDFPLAPVTLHEIDVVAAEAGYRNVTAYYTSREPVQIHWTIGEGFSPTDLDNRVRRLRGRNASRLSVPVDMPYDVLGLHIINANRSFEIKVDISYKATSDQMEIVDQYDLFVPRQTEIGISSSGKSRFHVFVNTTNTQFMFGMMQAEMTSVVGDKVNTFDAYSFFPDIPSSPIRVKKSVQTEAEYHAEILLHSADLYFVGGVVSVSCACSKMSDLIRRMDIKQTLYLHSRPDSPSIPTGSLGSIVQPTTKHVRVDRNNNIVLRCKAVGNPKPEVALHKIDGERLDPLNVPTYTTFLPLQTWSVFQLLNVTREVGGNYACRANNGVKTQDDFLTVTVA